MSEKIYLPISTNYVEHWGFWEAVRELLQNMVDTGTGEVDYSNRYHGYLKIVTTAGALDPSTLLLGESSKRDDSDTIGCYGEGYKLALLVLLRLELGVVIYNGTDKWIPSLEVHPQLGTECLCIEMIKECNTDDPNRVTFELSGLNGDDFDTIGVNFISTSHEYITVIGEYEDSFFFDNCNWETEGDEHEELDKKLYVGGLFVCDLPSDFRFSYNFAPSLLELDRDRQSVSTFDLQYEVVDLLIGSGSIEILLELATNNFEDVGSYARQYSHSHVTTDKGEKNLGVVTKEHFYNKYGKDAFPFSKNSDQGKIEVLTNQCYILGLKPVMLDQLYYSWLPDELKVLKGLPQAIQSKASKVLSDFLESHGKFLKAQPKRYLKKLIQSTKLGGN